MAAKAIYKRVVQDQEGNLVPSVEFTVIDEVSGLGLTIYSDRLGATTLTPPYFADVNGKIEFFVDPGTTFRVSGTGPTGSFTDRWVDGVLLGDDSGNVPTITILNTTVVGKIDSVADIAGFTGAVNDQQISLKGWHPDSDVGGGMLYWDADKPKSNHNGGTVFSPTVPFGTVADYLDGVGETDPAGSGCWVRQLDGFVTPEMFGAMGDYNETLNTGANDQPSVQAAINSIASGYASTLVLGRKYLLDTKYDDNNTLFLSSRESVTIKGSGYSSMLRNSDALDTHVLGFNAVKKINISGLQIVGRDPVAFGGGHRHINMESAEDVMLSDMMLTGSGRYSVGHQNGTLKRFIANNIIFSRIGNDCFDVKNKDFATDNTENFVISNIVVESYGLNNSAGFPPHSVIDCRAPIQISNISIRHIPENGYGIRLFGDSSGSTVVNVSNLSAVDPSTLVSDTRTALIKIDGEGYAPGSNKKTTISNITSKDAFYGVWVEAGVESLVIQGGSISGANDGVFTPTTASGINISSIHFEGSIRADIKIDSPNSSVEFCTSKNSNKFLEGSVFATSLRLAFNHIDPSTLTAWTLPSALLTGNTCTTIGNTGKGSPGCAILSDNGISAFKAVAQSAAHNGYLQANTGGSSVSLSAEGGETNIDIELKPKGSGRVKFGAFVASSDTPTTGYIVIEDSSGVVRKIAIID